MGESAGEDGSFLLPCYSSELVVCHFLQFITSTRTSACLGSVTVALVVDGHGES